MAENTDIDILVQENENIEKIIELFKDIHKVVKHEDFQKFTPEERHEFLISQYKDTSNAYPIVIRFIARDCRFNETALRKMLCKMRDEGRKLKQEREKNSKLFMNKKNQKRDPVKSMQKFVEYQADYAKFLYIEENKKNGLRFDQSKANGIWNAEYNSMISYFKKVRDDEEKNKNEFEEEKNKNLELRKRELLDFINSNDTPQSVEIPAESAAPPTAAPPTPEVDTDIFDKENFDSYVEELNNCKESFEKTEKLAEKLTPDQIAEYSDEIISRLQAVENAINDGFIKQDDYQKHIDAAKFCIDLLNSAVDVINTVIDKPAGLDLDWLEGTSAAPKKNNNKKQNKKSRR